MANPDDLVTYLVLSPEFGGTRFGPFEQLEVRLGSNGERCHIVLSEALGIAPEHVRLIRQGPQNLILAPAERTATVFLWKQGARRPTQLATPTAVRPGDAFSLATSDGPRFIVELGELPPEIKEKREQARSRAGVGRGRLTAKSMGTEVKRQAWTSVLVFGPAQMLQRAATFVRSGAIYQPRNVILGITIAGGWLLGGAMSCRSKSMFNQLQVTNTRYETCQGNLGIAESIGRGGADDTFELLSARVTTSTTLGNALEQDKKLGAAVKERARILMDKRKEFEWLLTPKDLQAGEFIDWRERLLAEEGLDRDTARLMVWVAASPKKARTEFQAIVDSEGADVCGRGVATMSYRQAAQLGLRPQADAFYRGLATQVDNPEQREPLLLQTLTFANRALPEESFESKVEPLNQSGENCISIVGEDDRTKPRQIVQALKKQLGGGAKFLPDTDTTYASLARVGKYWASDVLSNDYDGRDAPKIVFPPGSTPLSTTLDGYDKRGQWVLKQTAETVARSIILPCVMALNGQEEKTQKVIGDYGLPSAVNCLVLEWKLRNEGT